MNRPDPDFRSDTVTRPSAAMRAAMAEAEVGDDVYGEDATVQALEEQAADRLGQEAGLFVASGTQSNLCALLTHLARGDEVLSGESYHIVRYEGGGASVLGGALITPLPVDSCGGLAAGDIQAAIKPPDSHFARTRLLSLENTVHGVAQPLARLQALTGLARQAGLACHLDGARLMNAVLETGDEAAKFGQLFDSVSLCLSKGLGAPAGSVLTGSKPFIAAARRWRKMLGGGMRQSGILAAAGLYALEHHCQRLADDHKQASQLAAALNQTGGVRAEAATNMVFAMLDWQAAMGLPDWLAKQNIRISAPQKIQQEEAVLGRFRLVLHLDLDSRASSRLVEEIARYPGLQAI